MLMKFSMPITSASSTPSEKLRSSSRRGLRNGSGTVRQWAMKIHSASTPTKANRIIWVDSNQSSRCPRSKISWAAVMATESAMKPIQSKRTMVRLVWSRSANQMQTSAAMPGGTIMKKAARQS